jgi:Zn-dependent protease
MESLTPVGVAVFAGFMFCIVIHECAHALVADWLGDDTARVLGRITLNPVPHIDLFMSILLPVALWLSNAPLFGGAKPVPVDMHRLRGNRLTAMMWVALAGPVSNIVLAVLFALALNLVPWLLDHNPDFGKKVASAVSQLVLINVLLAMFNLIPIPPLDGSRILAALLPRQLGWYIYQYEQFGMILVMVMVFSGRTAFLLSAPVLRATNWLIHATAFGPWGSLIGT